MDWNGYFDGKLGQVAFFWAAITIFCVAFKYFKVDSPLKGWIALHKGSVDWLANAFFMAIAFAVQLMFNVAFWLAGLIVWGFICWGQQLWYEFWRWRARRNGRRQPAPPVFANIPTYRDFFPKKRQREHGGGHGGHGGH